VTARVLVARLDSDGDVLLAGPAVRAAAAGWRGRDTEVTLLCGPSGRAAAELLPGVARLLEWRCPWIDAHPTAVADADVTGLVDRIRALDFDVALVLTSFHQSPLPLALLLRLAGVPRIAAISTDYPGTLLDHRLRPDLDFADDQPEPLRALAVARAAGFALPPGDDGALAVLPPPDVTDLTGPPPYLVLHPGASVPARAWSADRCARAVAALHERGHRVLVTGGPDETVLTARVAGTAGIDLGGRTSLAQLAGVLAGASAVVVGNTGPAHLAAAVGTPVVSLFAPVVPAARWAPYGVPVRLLGDQDAPCRDTRARTCPLPGHPCLDGVPVSEVVEAVDEVCGVAA
jgi:ADP-heptose:LPS heptosyltransferase